MTVPETNYLLISLEMKISHCNRGFYGLTLEKTFLKKMQYLIIVCSRPVQLLRTLLVYQSQDGEISFSLYRAMLKHSMRSSEQLYVSLTFQDKQTVQYIVLRALQTVTYLFLIAYIVKMRSLLRIATGNLVFITVKHLFGYQQIQGLLAS